jgi:hypothetical protein
MLQLIHLVKHDVNPINQIPFIYFHKRNYILIVEITYPIALINNLQQGYKLDVILMHHIRNTPLFLLNMCMGFNYNIYMCMFCTLLCVNIKLWFAYIKNLELLYLMVDLLMHTTFFCTHAKMWSIVIIFHDALPTPFIDSNVNLRWKQRKSKELGHVPWLLALQG